MRGKNILKDYFPALRGFPGSSNGKESALQCGRPGFDPYVGTIPWRRAWQLTPVFLLGKFHGQRSLVGYSPWGRKESDTTERALMAKSFEESGDFDLLIRQTENHE